MPVFRCRAADAAGDIRELLIDGVDDADAARRLRSRGLTPVQVLGEDIGGAPARGFDAVDFTDRLVPLLTAGIALDAALGMLEESGPAAGERQVLADLRRGLREGRRFADLVRERPRLFPPLYAPVVAAGEEAGALATTLVGLRDYLRLMRELRATVVSASIYPAFVVSFCVLVVVILLTVVLPRFAGVIRGLGTPPTGSTRALLALSSFLTHWWWALAVGVLAVALAVAVLRRLPAVRAAWDALLLRLPGCRRFIVLADGGRLARTMAILLRNGVPLLDACAVATAVIQNGCLRRSLAGVTAALGHGERLAAALGRSPYLPPLFLRLLAVGEETGNPAAMLEQVAARYEDELRRRIKRALAWFEPLTILVLGAIVGVIVFALFVAILDMQGGF